MSAVTVAADRVESVVWTLARIEIKRYLRHPLYLIGAVILALSVIAIFRAAEKDNSPLSGPMAPAFLMGVFGVIVGAQLARSSYKVGRAAGDPPVPERTRTLALAISFVVPVATAAVWTIAFLVVYSIHSPRADAWWFDDLSTVHVLSVLIGTGVLAGFGGPALGLLVSRWVGWRPAPLMVALLLVVSSMFTQTDIPFPKVLRLVMPWTQWAEGVTNGKAVYFPGNPTWWTLYAVALCALAVLAAMRHDPESDVHRYRVVAGGLLVVAVVSVVLSMTAGATHIRYIPVSTTATTSSST
jgi:hypothetical protein